GAAVADRYDTAYRCGLCGAGCRVAVSVLCAGKSLCERTEGGRGGNLTETKARMSRAPGLEFSAPRPIAIIPALHWFCRLTGRALWGRQPCRSSADLADS